MKFVEPRPYADPDAARKLVEIASTIEPVQGGYIELVNAPFLYEHLSTRARRPNTRPVSSGDRQGLYVAALRAMRSALHLCLR
jgi:hypothetical protein